MDELIEALGIFKTYTEAKYPTNCAHDELQVNVSPEKVTESDKERLEKLGFLPDGDYFTSYRFGSC